MRALRVFIYFFRVISNAAIYHILNTFFHLDFGGPAALRRKHKYWIIQIHVEICMCKHARTPSTISPSHIKFRIKIDQRSAAFN